jgi:hypothetical protein
MDSETDGGRATGERHKHRIQEPHFKAEVNRGREIPP